MKPLPSPVSRRSAQPVPAQWLSWNRCYPEAREVVAHHPDRRSQAFVMGEELSGEDVLPGFRLPLADVFEGL